MELIIIKALSVIFIVLALTYIAENVSVKSSGIVSGLPTGSLITFTFIAIEFGTNYVQEISLYSINGLISNLLFCVGYYISTFYKGKNSLVVSIVTSLAFYGLPAIFLSSIVPSINTTPFYVLPILIMAVLYFVSTDDHNIEQAQKLTALSFIARILLTVLIFLIISGLPNYVPVNLAGYFSSGPIILLPLIVIIHYNYSRFQARTIAKNAPLGFPGGVTFCIMIYFTIDSNGIFLGIIFSLFVSLIVIYLQTKLLVLYKRRFLKRAVL